MAKRVIMRVEISPEARDTIGEITEMFGMTTVAVNSRLVTWLSKQTDVVQAIVLGLHPETSKDVVQIIMKQMATENKR